MKKAIACATMFAAVWAGTAIFSSPSWAQYSPYHGRLERAAPARDRFDGQWSVTIVTRGGACEPAYRYRVEINGGVISPGENAAGADVAGQVTPRGDVRVSVRQGDNVAYGTGRLSGNVGEGQWNGRSPTEACTGYWQARRFG